MSIKEFTTKVPFNEILFQVLLNITVFVFFAFDRRIPGIEFHQIFFFLNYAIASLIINYILLPRFLYKRRYLPFIIYSIIVIGLIIFVEEAILEKIYYPDTRGRRFMGVFFNLLSTMPTLTMLVGFKFAWDALTNQREVQELRNSVKESELQFLKSQINPHFLFNNMNNLYAHAVEKSEKTPEIILELSSVLRYMLYECKSEFVPFKKELEQLENYINLSRMQIEGRGEVNYNVETKTTNLFIAPLILTVFVENAFKHSASSQAEDIKIDIDINVDQKGILNFNCKNSFQQLSNVDKLDKGIGLENVKKRLNLIYPNSHQLAIKKDNKFFKVSLMIDLNKAKK